MTRPNLLRDLARFVLFFSVILTLSANASAQDVKTTSPAPSPTEISSSKLSSYDQAGAAHEARISPGDVVEVKIFGLPEMNQEVRVSDTGNIELPLIGPVAAQGLTASELEQKIAAALRSGGFMNDPQVNVAAKELRSSGVSVSGEVGKTGIYPVFGSTSLTELLMVAGGLTPKSGHIVTLTHSDQPDKPVNVDISSISGQNIAVFPGDTVVVTKAGVVYVLGDVGHPAGFVMEDDAKMTVLQALASAGGANKDAKIKSARIIRKSPQGIQQVPIPLKEILSAKKEDVELLPGDVLYIPGGNFFRNEGAILQAATMAAIFH